jgi:HK97 family phage prohead protease/HK97 family phage major capsid protein
VEKQFELLSNFQVKGLFDSESDDLIIEGYANTTEKDRVGDVVQKEAWQGDGLKNFLKNPIVLAFHDRAKPVGKVTGMSVDDGGLKVTAKISKSVGEVYNLVKEGILSTFSVGFNLVDADYDKESDTFFIKDLELLEVSIVSIPANAGSTFSVKKSFEDTDEYENFKSNFAKEDETKKEVSEEPSELDISEIIRKTAEETAKLFTKSEEKQEELPAEKSEETVEETVEKTEEQETNKGDKMTTEVTQDAIEKLMAAVEKKFEDYDKKQADAVAGGAEKEAEISNLVKEMEELRGELAEKSEEIENFRKNKMQFQERGEGVTKEERMNAVLLAKCMRRKVEETEYGKSIIEKSGHEHYNASVATDGTNPLWETDLTTSIENDYRNRLVVADAMSSGGTRLIRMPTPTFRLPVNPEAGTGYWIPNSYLRSTQGPLAGSPSSTGTAAVHELQDVTLTAYKLASKEYLGDEEEEDSLIPLLPIIRDAIARRMARSWDIALLRGAGSPGAQLASNDPISGVLTRAGSPGTSGNVSSISKMTVATLQTMRRGLGARGLNPNDVVYIVSYDAYYDLLEDPDFRTPDVIGADKATILKGTIGMVNGSQVIASGEFATKAANVGGAVCVYRNNFMIGELRGMSLERDRSVEDQVNILVATRRAAFQQIIANAGVTAGFWAS